MTMPGTHTQPAPGKKTAKRTSSRTRKLVVFSADLDIAKSFTLLLEESYAVTYETDLEKLRAKILDVGPSLLLLDLCPLPTDILRTIDVLRHMNRTFPVVTLHVYRNSLPDMEKAIRSVSDIVLYKPVTAELVTELISVLMAVQQDNSRKSTTAADFLAQAEHEKSVH